MRLSVHVHGMTFESVSHESTAEDARDLIYSNIENMNKFEMRCTDGSFLILGEEALSNALIVVSEK